MNGQSVLQNGANLFMSVAQKGLEDVNTSMNLRSKTTTSALPRFSAASVKKISIGAPPASAAAPLQEKKRLVTEQSTAERAATTPHRAASTKSKTPAKKDVLTICDDKAMNLSSSCNSLIKRLKKSISNSPSPEVIRQQFDTGFTIHEDRVATIMLHLKVKNKWDYKEKSKKQDAVIKELRDCITATFGEIKAVREQCLLHENHTNNLIRDSYEELLEVSQTLNLLQSTSLQSQQELLKAQEELRNTSSTMMKFKTESSPLRNRNKEYETRIMELQTALLMEQTQADQAKNELAKLQQEHAELKANSGTSLASQKEEYEQVHTFGVFLYIYLHLYNNYIVSNVYLPLVFRSALSNPCRATERKWPPCAPS